jgi:hypothetical protein
VLVEGPFEASTITAPAAADSEHGFYRDGWVLTGWNTREDMNGTRYLPLQEIPVTSETMTLVAEWTRCYQDDCADWETRGRLRHQIPLYLTTYLTNPAVFETSTSGRFLRYPTIQDVLGSNAVLPNGMNFIGWNSNPEPGLGRWHHPGDTVDYQWYLPESSQAGIDVSMYDDRLYAFYSPTCTTFVNCNDYYVAIQATIGARGSFSPNSVDTSTVAFFPLGSGDSLTVYLDRGYGVSSVVLEDNSTVGSLSEISLTRSYVLDIQVARLQYSGSAIYYEYSDGTGGSDAEIFNPPPALRNSAGAKVNAVKNGKKAIDSTIWLPPLTSIPRSRVSTTRNHQWEKWSQGRNAICPAEVTVPWCNQMMAPWKKRELNRNCCQ